MKRRNLLKNGVLLAASPITLVPTRLYGMPKSVSPADYAEDLKFILPLSRAGMPTDLLQIASAVTDLWNTVLSSAEEQAAFVANPVSLLAKFGLDTSETVVNDSSVKLLTALAEPDVRHLLAIQDYPGLFSRMETLGAFEVTSTSKLQVLMEARIAQQVDSLKDYIATRTGQNSDVLAEGVVMDGVVATPDDLASLHLLLADSLAGASPLRTVSTTVTVVTGYVAALAFVVVVAAAAVATIVAAFGCDVAKHKSGINPEYDESVGNDVVTPAFGSLAMADPAIMRNAERAQRLANLTGDQDIVAFSGRQMIQAEISAIITAMNNTGVLPLAEGKVQVVVEALTRYAWKTAGLAVP